MPSHQRRVAFATAALVCAGSAFGPVVAQADSTGSFYVNNAAAADCSDSTTDSATTPYCTIQAAVTAATAPGDTVTVSPGTYAPFTVTASGTAAAPITVEATTGTGIALVAPYAAITATSSSAVTLDGASHVSIQGFRITEQSNNNAVAVTGSTDDTVDSTYVTMTGDQSAPIVAIGSGSSSITLSRDYLSGTTTGGAVSVQGGSDDVITTDYMVDQIGSGVVLNGTTSSDVTSNTFRSSCGTAIGLTNGSTSGSVENNVAQVLSTQPTLCGATNADEVSLSVDAASASGTSADYNDMALNGSRTEVYSWAGTFYSKSAALDAATGQGSHDSNLSTATASIDSANSDAPGELSTDILDRPRNDDPDVANTGTGTFGYYDRGDEETVESISNAPAANWPEQAPVGGVGTYAVTASDGWGNAFTCTYDFGDGSAPVTVTPDASGMCSAQHAFSATGSYTGSVRIDSVNGMLAETAFTVKVVADTPLTPNVTVAAQGAEGVQVDAETSTDGWTISKCSVDFGDGTAPSVANVTGCLFDHTYAQPGTYTVTTTLTDSDGNQRTATDTFSTAATEFTPVTPTRILDTRSGTGVAAAGAVAPEGQVRLKIAGVDGLPSTGVTAVALNVTATEATKSGVITACPDGSALPGVSNVDFHADQNVANTVIVAVGADGYVDLANVSTGKTHVIADLEGYYSATGDSGYHSISPTRVLDTRKTAVVPAGSTVKVKLSSYAGISAAMFNVTVVDATGNGFVTAAPDGGATPATSNVNYLAGQTVPNEVVVSVGADGYVDFTNSGKGQADLVVDLDGYFTTGSGDYFVPIDPERSVDSRNSLDFIGALGADETIPAEIAGVCPPLDCATKGIEIPMGASAVAANLTVVSPTANGFITVFPADGSTAPTASVLNFLAGQQTQNAITVGLGSTNGEFDVDNASKGLTQVVVDVFGYYGS
ncbi:right-handed parallel beta-helix repeat-containing protein [Actinospica durhamensis]|uniref:Right-handed parallel beta-helix repeat-containing protein n=1 Tax=Actinospica durhamensis TaxID=1508375 RepID=A0A941ER55_9ACTN|nr:right-handed parallel beta-helix repeat-containing protein [Actinospica durhamensis]MBR7833604.1 right-handed parallel beta-helix repeat-containing protein [Actinospica durhamensis]